MRVKAFLTALLSLAIFTAIAQQAVSDKIKTMKGDLVIRPILHGAMVLSWDTKTIYIDPYGGAEAYTGVAAPDIILITDIHGDHLNLKTLEAIDTENAVFVVPQAVADMLPKKYKRHLVVLQNGSSTTQQGIPIRAIHMYNLPGTPESRHPKGRGNGYILDLAGTNVYISGDTEDIPEMRALKNIDVAFVCMNLPFTMSVEQAASAVLDFRPKVVYPYHYRGQNDLADVAAFKKMVKAKNSDIEVRLANWYPEQ